MSWRIRRQETPLLPNGVANSNRSISRRAISSLRDPVGQRFSYSGGFHAVRTVAVG
jgi:hypothetical protein